MGGSCCRLPPTAQLPRLQQYPPPHTHTCWAHVNRLHGGCGMHAAGAGLACGTAPPHAAPGDARNQENRDRAANRASCVW